MSTPQALRAAIAALLSALLALLLLLKAGEATARPPLIPLVTVVGLQFGSLMGQAVVVDGGATI